MTRTPAAMSPLEEALKTAFSILKAVLIICTIGLLLSGIFIVQQNEAAVILRFGSIAGTKADRVLKPGMHFSLPYPIDEVIRIPVELARTIEVDDFWYAMTEEEKIAGAVKNPPQSLRPGIDGYAITGDMNVLHTKWNVSYLIKDPVDYTFSYEDLETIIKNVLCNAVVCVSGGMFIDDIMRHKREEFRTSVASLFAQFCATAGIGIEIQAVDLVQIGAPPQVTGAFNAVLEAEQEKNQKINSARAYADKVISDAKGKAGAVISRAQGYKTRYTEIIAAEKDYFLSILSHYEADPVSVTNSLYLSVIKKVLEQADHVFTLREKAPGREIRIMMNKKTVKESK